MNKNLTIFATVSTVAICTASFLIKEGGVAFWGLMFLYILVYNLNGKESE